LSISLNRVIMTVTGVKIADCSQCGEVNSQRKSGWETMTAFKSDGSMRLSGKSARRWAKKIRMEKAQQRNGKSKKKR
jgi:hypothetical protein